MSAFEPKLRQVSFARLTNLDEGQPEIGVVESGQWRQREPAQSA